MTERPIPLTFGGRVIGEAVVHDDGTFTARFDEWPHDVPVFIGRPDPTRVVREWEWPTEPEPDVDAVPLRYVTIIDDPPPRSERPWRRRHRRWVIGRWRRR